MHVLRAIPRHQLNGSDPYFLTAVPRQLQRQLRRHASEVLAALTLMQCSHTADRVNADAWGHRG